MKEDVEDRLDERQKRRRRLTHKCQQEFCCSRDQAGRCVIHLSMGLGSYGCRDRLSKTCY